MEAQREILVTHTHMNLKKIIFLIFTAHLFIMSGGTNILITAKATQWMLETQISGSFFYLFINVFSFNLKIDIKTIQVP